MNILNFVNSSNIWLIGLLVIAAVIYLMKSSHSPPLPAYYDQIEEHTLKNQAYRKVLYTTDKMQLVLMSLLPGEEIGEETHPETSQFIRVEAGEGIAQIDGKDYPMSDGNVVVIPPGARHNLINTSSPPERLQLYSIYTPPEHPINTLQTMKPHHSDHANH